MSVIFCAMRELEIVFLFIILVGIVVNVVLDSMVVVP